MKSDGVDRQTLEYALTWSDRPSDCEHHDEAPPPARNRWVESIKSGCCFWGRISPQVLIYE
jgi:hypothetical protein